MYGTCTWLAIAGRRGWLLLAVLFFSACCPPSETVSHCPDPRRFTGLPRSSDDLLRLADQLLAHQAQGASSLAEIDRAIAALNTAQQQRNSLAQKYEISWRQARGYFLQTNALHDRQQRINAAHQGIAYSRQAVALASGRVEGHYYLAVNLGQLAEARAELELIKPMIAAAERARQIDERYDHAGPLVLLGKVHLTAPAWPVSVGNIEKAIELLERAMIIAPRPLTRVFLGEAYYKDEQFERARQQLRRALEHADQLAPRWRREAEETLRRASEESSRALPSPEQHG